MMSEPEVHRRRPPLDAQKPGEAVPGIPPPMRDPKLRNSFERDWPSERDWR